jgi:hypothetical protein
MKGCYEQYRNMSPRISEIVSRFWWRWLIVVEVDGEGWWELFKTSKGRYRTIVYSSGEEELWETREVGDELLVNSTEYIHLLYYKNRRKQGNNESEYDASYDDTWDDDEAVQYWNYHKTIPCNGKSMGKALGKSMRKAMCKSMSAIMTK